MHRPRIIVILASMAAFLSVSTGCASVKNDTAGDKCRATVAASASAKDPEAMGELLRESLDACRTRTAWLEAIHRTEGAMVWVDDEQAIDTVCWAWPDTAACTN